MSTAAERIKVGLEEAFAIAEGRAMPVVSVDYTAHPFSGDPAEADAIAAAHAADGWQFAFATHTEADGHRVWLKRHAATRKPSAAADASVQTCVRGEVTLPPGVPEPQTITVTEEMVARGAGGAGGWRRGHPSRLRSSPARR